MESITTIKCAICGVVHEGDFWHLRQYFTTSKTYKTGLDPRCKECKKIIAKKYRTKQITVETNSKHKETKRKAFVIYQVYE